MSFRDCVASAISPSLIGRLDNESEIPLSTAAHMHLDFTYPINKLAYRHENTRKTNLEIDLREVGSANLKAVESYVKGRRSMRLVQKFRSGRLLSLCSVFFKFIYRSSKALQAASRILI